MVNGARYELVAVAPMWPTGPSFATPLYRNGDTANTIFYQKIDNQGKIIAFVRVDPSLRGRAYATTEGVVRRIGDDAIYGFVVSKDELFVGIKEQMITYVRMKYDKMPLRVHMRHAIAKFIDDKELMRASGDAVRNWRQERTKESGLWENRSTVRQETVMSGFSSRIIKLLERVEYRRADTQEEKEAILRMRYDGYVRDGSIQQNHDGIFTDAADNVPNAWLVGMLIDGELAACIRIHVASRPEHFLPVTQAFPDIIVPRLVSGEVIINFSRHVCKLEYARAYPFLPYLTFRVMFVAQDYFGSNYIAGACRPEYVAAFRRMYGFVSWAPARPYPPLTRLQVLVGYDCRANAAETRRRYPFVTSTLAEQSALFERSSNVAKSQYGDLIAGRRVQRNPVMPQSSTYSGQIPSSKDLYADGLKLLA